MDKNSQDQPLTRVERRRKERMKKRKTQMDSTSPSEKDQEPSLADQPEDPSTNDAYNLEPNPVDESLDQPNPSFPNVKKVEEDYEDAPVIVHADDPKRTSIDKVYYWIIGFLFLVILLLIVFVSLNFGDNGSDDYAGTADIDNQTEELAQESEPALDTDQQVGETSELTEEQDLNSSQVYDAEQIPHDETYTVDYSTGSADRLEIASVVSSVTGIPQDSMVEEWVGNGGPGRVEATVFNQYNPSERYVVTLQHGDGQWYPIDVSS